MRFLRRLRLVVRRWVSARGRSALAVVADVVGFAGLTVGVGLFSWRVGWIIGGLSVLMLAGLHIHNE